LPKSYVDDDESNISWVQWTLFCGSKGNQCLWRNHSPSHSGKMMNVWQFTNAVSTHLEQLCLYDYWLRNINYRHHRHHHHHHVGPEVRFEWKMFACDGTWKYMHR
jgi:hypothetical protein